MREIKFRVWDDHPEVQGYLDTDSVFLMTNGDSLIDDVGDVIDMSMTTVEQYTGMEDWGNTEIFEGDILNDVDDGTVIGSVEYIDDYASYWCGTMPLSDVAPDSQVCGNIHEEKELLGERE